MAHHRFTVRGYSAFPLDMLRYDACYPDRQEDVAELHATLDVHELHGRLHAKQPFVVQLKSNHPPEPARWASFSWKVISVVKS